MVWCWYGEENVLRIALANWYCIGFSSPAWPLMEPTGSTCDVNTIPMAEPSDVLFFSGSRQHFLVPRLTLSSTVPQFSPNWNFPSFRKEGSLSVSGSWHRGAGSAGKIIEDQSSTPRTLVKGMNVLAVLIISALWTQLWREGAQGSLVSKPSLLGEFQASGNPCP